MLDQSRDVLAALLQRRQRQRDHVQAVEQVVAKLARLDLLFQILVRRRHHAHIGLHFPRPADPAITIVFQHAQEFGLQRRRHLGNLVNEQRAALGHLEQPRLGVYRAGERSFFVSE